MTYTQRVLAQIKIKDQGQPEFIQAVEEVFQSLQLIIDHHPEYESLGILERLIEPERIIQFRVPWLDDQGVIKVNRGFRVQFNGVLGPYKGGLRFHPSVNLGMMKFLAFEQVFKNALTTMPIGGGKGGCDFDPKGKSDKEIYRFCASFMNELYRHIGPDVDVPAGDMGVGAREIGYLFGHYRRLKGTNEPGVLTGKGLGYGGSLVRKEATGYGLLYLVKEIAKANQLTLQGQKVIVSGSGNVAIYAAEKAQAMDMQVIAMSDSQGYIIDDQINITTVKKIKEELRGSLVSYLDYHPTATYHLGSIYDAGLTAQIILPCGTQNEINELQAQQLIDHGAVIIAEGANMPCSNEAIALYQQHQLFFIPGKAANAGGVATSALEMSQNSIRMHWSFEEVDSKLQCIMEAIHMQMQSAMKKYQLAPYDYLRAANLAGAEKVIQAMIAQGEY
jgi:glutamate dehydrogenase (NADP+)